MPLGLFQRFIEPFQPGSMGVQTVMELLKSFMPTPENRKSNENLLCFPAAPKAQTPYFTEQGAEMQKGVFCKADQW